MLSLTPNTSLEEGPVLTGHRVQLIGLALVEHTPSCTQKTTSHRWCGSWEITLNSFKQTARLWQGEREFDQALLDASGRREMVTKMVERARQAPPSPTLWERLSKDDPCP